MLTNDYEKPNYNDKVQGILRGLAAGKTREQLAAEAGNKNWRSIDSYMRKQHFIWDSRKGNYVPKISPLENDMFVDSSKAGHVISLLDKEGADVRSVADRLGFHDHRELADYMNTKGYVWDNDQMNYVKQVGQVPEEKMEYSERISSKRSFEPSSQDSEIRSNDPKGFDHYLPLLEMLETYKERLLDVIVPTSQTGTLPRFVVPGVGKTKTVQMMNTLEQLVVDFSREKNISQRELFEVALIEFFRKYGYEQEVERLLKR